jgi:dTDP-4-dehydrorhamnose 3,5-epimerase-like enzyme|tara:strand:- start:500 stop:904 length:405 start_codon:yes stop_codon:yes gene_type:complete
MKEKKDYLKSFDDKDGWLLPVEFSILNFIPKRVFVVNNVPAGKIRGNHSHYKTRQYLICTNGSVKVFLDDGKKTEEILLTKNESILIPELIWDSQQFLSEDSEILVICSTEYDIKDYILDYKEFKNIIDGKRDD